MDEAIAEALGRYAAVPWFTPLEVIERYGSGQWDRIWYETWLLSSGVLPERIAAEFSYFCVLRIIIEHDIPHPSKRPPPPRELLEPRLVALSTVDGPE